MTKGSDADGDGGYDEEDLDSGDGMPQIKRMNRGQRKGGRGGKKDKNANQAANIKSKTLQLQTKVQQQLSQTL